MRGSTACWLVVLLVVGAGCSAVKGYPARTGDPSAELTGLADYFKPEVVKASQAPNLDEGTRRHLRDEIVNARIRAIDMQFGIFEQALAQEGVLLNLGLDWAVIGLGAAGALVPGASTKAILAAVSGGLTGGKASIDKNVFYEKTMPVLLTKMESLRKEALVPIRSGLRFPTDAYPLSHALIDVENYYKAGTIPGAILGIANTAGAANVAAQSELKSLMEVRYVVSGPTRAARDKIMAWLESNPSANVPALQQWLRAQRPPITESPATWVNGPTATAQTLQKAITELSIP